MDPIVILTALLLFGAALAIKVQSSSEARANRRAEKAIDLGWRALNAERGSVQLLKRRAEERDAEVSARDIQLGPREKLDALVEAYRDKDAQRRMQMTPLRAIAVAAAEVVKASTNQMELPGAIAKLRKAIGANVWLPDEPETQQKAATRNVWNDDPPEAA